MRLRRPGSLPQQHSDHFRTPRSLAGALAAPCCKRLLKAPLLQPEPPRKSEQAQAVAQWALQETRKELEALQIAAAEP